jgi:hypothetical protein
VRECLCIPVTFLKLLPRWLIVFGLVLAVIGELSWFNLILPQALLLIPLTRFPGFISRPVPGLGYRLAAGSSNHRPHGAVVDLACLVIGLFFADRQPGL